MKINDWIDNSPAVHYFMALGSLMFAGMALNSKRYLALAFCVGASVIFLPPMQKNFNKALGNNIERKYFMYMGIIMLIIALVALVKI